MIRHTLLAVTLAIGGAVAVAFSTRAQSVPQTPPAAGQPAPHQMAGMAMPDAQMAGMHEKMMAEMKAIDVKLDALVTRMNAAKGNAKVDAMAELLTTLVGQHKAMHAGMAQMQDQMMMPMRGSMAMPMGGK